MASPYSVLALDAAGWLDHELVAATSQLDALDAKANPNHDLSRLAQALAAAVSTARELRQHLVCAATSADEAPIDVCERALRARWNVVLRALDALSRVEREIPASAFIGHFTSLRDVKAFVTGQLTEIHARWAEQERAHERVDPEVQRALTYADLDEAEMSFERLGRDRALGHFLQAASESPSIVVRAACQEVALIMGATSGHRPVRRRSVRSGRTAVGGCAP